jgi:CIC family chloride channel protein
MNVSRKIREFLNPLLRRFFQLGERRQLIILALLVGIGSGLAAVLLKHTIHLVKDLLTSWFNAETGSFLYLAYPGIGILITILFVRYFVKDDIGHGITKILYAISRKKSKLKPRNCYTSIIASSFTIGFGGSVGAEAPIVLTGASIGSTIGQFLKLNYRTITMLVGCGAAGAVAGIFKAPLAGIVFTLEILMLDLTLSFVVPLLVASVTATGVSYLLLGFEMEFASSAIQPFAMGNIPYYIFLGIFCGFAALYFTRATLAIEGRLAKIIKPYKKWLIGAVALGIMIFFIPPLYGEGYDIITALLNDRSDEVFANSIFFDYRYTFIFILIYLVLIMVFKVAAMAFTNGSGGVGGTFGPTLFMGGIAGFFVANVINYTGITTVPEANFTLVGMGGMMAGVMHAPLTAIFLIAEITGGYALFMPLIITSVTAFLTMRTFEKHSIYTKRLALRGELITHNKDKAALTLLKVSDLIERDFGAVLPADSLGRLVRIISKSKRNIFPVIKPNGELAGIVLLDDIREIMFDASRYNTVFVEELMVPARGFVREEDTLEDVLDKFEKTKSWNLPVVNKDNRYIGFLSKSRILTAYRDVLLEFSEE